MLVDAHCHLDEIPNYQRGSNILPVTSGHSHNANVKTVAIAKMLSIPFVLGIAPQTAQKEDIDKLEEWTEYICQNKPNAIGEIGLDFHWAKTTEHKEKQYLIFSRMLDVAEELGLPVVLHCRDAGDELLDVLKQRSLAKGAMWHFFSGNEEQTKRALNMGISLSFPPLPSGARKKALVRAPLENILAETDAPVIARKPEEVVKSVEYIAGIKKLDFEEVAMQTAKNAARLFNFRL